MAPLCYLAHLAVRLQLMPARKRKKRKMELPIFRDSYSRHIHVVMLELSLIKFCYWRGADHEWWGGMLNQTPNSPSVLVKESYSREK